MNMKFLIALITACSLLASANLFAQTTTATGTVVAVTQGTLTIQQGADQWVIKRTTSTQVTSGDLKIGSTVTVKYNAPDGQKKEGPVTTGTSTPPPAGR